VTGLVVGSNSTGPAHPAGAENGSRALEMTPAEEFFRSVTKTMFAGLFQGNMLISRFKKRSEDIKVLLFKNCKSSMYG
jgi:hypothetical protein